MRIAYFVNEYPAVSHSFIRREILSLEKQGVEVVRIALRTDQSLVIDPVDVEEYKKTHLILEQSPFLILFLCLKYFLLRPISWMRSLFLAIKVGWSSDSGLLRHLAYFVEACVLLEWTYKFKIQHIHAHFGTNSTAIAMLAKELGGVSYSMTTHGPDEFDRPVSMSLGEKICRSSFAVGISSFSRSQLLRWIPYEHWHKAVVVHCGLDEVFYSGDVEPVSDVPRFVCIGRLCEQKGQLLLLRAFGELHQEGEDFELVFAGDGDMRPEVERLIEKYGIASKVRITGWISNQQVRDEILQSRAMILPSFAEGLPVAIMEALALKRPVISTFIAGIPELVNSKDIGWLVPASNVSLLKKTIREVLHMPVETLQQMGEKGRERVLERHNIDTEAGKLLGHFKNVVVGQDAS